MSKNHPIVAVTGASVAGTSTVKKAFEHIFTRENITPVVIEGDSFHRHDRVAMKEAMSAAEKEWMDEQLYQKRQMDWLGTQVRGTAPITPLISTVTDRSVGKTYSPSPLSQVATGLATYKALT